MTNSPLHGLRRPALTAAPWRVAALILLAAVAACRDTTGPTAAPIEVMEASSMPYRAVLVAVRGSTIPATPIPGTLGAVPVTASRLDDTTVAVVVPEIAAGEHELRLSIAGQELVTTLRVSAAPAIGDLRQVVDAVLAARLANADSLEATIGAGDTMSAAAPQDTAAMRDLVAAIRSGVADVRAQVAAMSTADVTALARLVVANRDLLEGTPAPSFAASDASGNIVPPDAFPSLTHCRLFGEDCASDFGAQWTSIKATVVGCLWSHRRMVVAGAVVGAVLGGPVGAAWGGMIGGVAGVALCVTSITDQATGTITLPVIARLSNTSNLMDGEDAGMATDASMIGPNEAGQPASSSVFKVGTARTLVVTAEVRSLVAGDAGGPGPVAAAVAKLNDARAAWLNGIDDLGGSRLIPRPPALPTTPARTVVREVPVANLRMGPISPAPATATTGGSGTSWQVTFQNAGQGKDHPLSYRIRLVQSGFPDQEKTMTGTLQPKRYAVASVAIAESNPEVVKGASMQLTALVKDSTGRVMPTAELAERAPTWLSANTKIATVGASSGLVTGVDSGSTTITAKSDGKQGSTTVKVGGDGGVLTYVLRGVTYRLSATRINNSSTTHFISAYPSGSCSNGVGVTVRDQVGTHTMSTSDAYVQLAGPEGMGCWQGYPYYASAGAAVTITVTSVSPRVVGTFTATVVNADAYDRSPREVIRESVTGSFNVPRQ